jgi:adenylate cyclase
MARIIIISDENAEPVDLREDVSVMGRLPDNHIVLSDALASRKHAEIRRVGDAYRIVDLESLNGVYVNNLKIEDEQLTHGDVISIGESRLLFEDAPEGGAQDLKSLSPRPSGPQKKGGPEPTPAAGMRHYIPGLSEREIIKPLSEAEPDYEIEVFNLSDALKPLHEAVVSKEAEPAKSRHFFILYQVARALNSSTSLSELLELTMTLLFQVINAERGVIFLFNDDDELEPEFSRNRSGGELPEMTVSKTITKRAIDQHSAILTSDACYDPRFEGGASIIAYNIRSALCVPLWDRDKVRGAIYLDNLMETYAFNEDELDLLTAIANQVAIAVNRDEMHKRMQETAVARSNLERFHSPDVVNHIMQQSKDEEVFQRFLNDREVTVLFADICNFTPLLEGMGPQDAADLLIDYFDEMTDIIFKYKGTVDKFIGDAIMAIFGAPISRGNDAELAIFSAIEMMKQLEKFKAQRDKSKAFDIRIGINTGIVAAGYLGSKSRIEYTVLGDPVNVAARLQDFAKPGTIIVGEQTYNKVKGLFKLEDRGLTRLKGKKQKTRVYEVKF